MVELKLMNPSEGTKLRLLRASLAEGQYINIETVYTVTALKSSSHSVRNGMQKSAEQKFYGAKEERNREWMCHQKRQLQQHKPGEEMANSSLFVNIKY
jgi:hypothetical protein